MKINIMIPVLNEEEQIVTNVKKVIDYLKDTKLEGNYVITIADNGSTDKTPELGRQLVQECDGKVNYIRLEERGVGLAFRETIKANTYDIVGYMDLDLATDIKHLNEVYAAFEDGASIVVGSRLLKGSKVIGRTLLREITSRGLNFLMKFVLSAKFSDAMCGFKFYRKETADALVAKASDSNGWFYCAEMLVRAEWDGIKITEIPVTWTDDPNSKVKVGRLSMSYMQEIKKLFIEKQQRKKNK